MTRIPLLSFNFCLVLAILICYSQIESRCFAQSTNSDSQSDAAASFKKQQAADEAELAARQAHQKLEDFKKTAEAAENPDPIAKANQDKIAAATAAKTVSDAQKAATDAAKSTSDSEAAALKAQFGDIPDSGFTSKTDIKDKAGNTEALLLAAKALNNASETISKNVLNKTNDKNKTGANEIWLFALSDLPDFQSLLVFTVNDRLIIKTFDEAKNSATASLKAAQLPEPQNVLPVAAVGLGLDALNKILGFFRTDYTIGGVDVSLEDSALINAVAGKLGQNAHVPALINYDALSKDTLGILDKIQKWGDNRAMTQERSVQFAFEAKKLTAASTAAGLSQDQKDKLQKQASIYQQNADLLNKAVSYYDGVAAKLTSPDEKGSIPLATVIKEQTIFNLLKPPAPPAPPAPPDSPGYLLLVKIHKLGGAYYTKRNMWTLFGTMPFYSMGGAVVSYILIGPKGVVADSGLLTIDGGFVKATNLPAALK